MIDGILTSTWLGTDPCKYIKRPMLLAVTFGMACLSTRYYKKPISRFVRHLDKRWTRKAAPQC